MNFSDCFALKARNESKYVRYCELGEAIYYFYSLLCNLKYYTNFAVS